MPGSLQQQQEHRRGHHRSSSSRNNAVEPSFSAPTNDRTASVKDRETSRPQFVRRDTEMLGVLDYYHSKDAATPQSSSASSSDSEAAHRNIHYAIRAVKPQGQDLVQSASNPGTQYPHEAVVARRQPSTSTLRGDDILQQRYEGGLPTPTSATFPADTRAGNDSDHSASNVKRKPSVRAAANADNRRLAIIDLNHSQLPSPDPSSAADYLSGTSVSSAEKHPNLVQSSSKDISNHLSSPRGAEQPKLAIIAPPDADPSSYTDLTPPATDKNPDKNSTTQQDISSPPSLHHKLSKSSADQPLTSSNLESTDMSAYGQPVFPSSSSSSYPRPIQYGDGLNLQGQLLYQSTMSGGPYAPPYVPRYVQAASAGALASPWAPASPNISTPAIGESKEVGDKVAGPTVRKLSEAEMNWPMSSNTGYMAQNMSAQSSDFPAPHVTVVPYPGQQSDDMSYMFFDSALHGSAGPPPEPPKVPQDTLSSSPPPRPPRLSPPSSSRKQQNYPSIHDIQSPPDQELDPSAQPIPSPSNTISRHSRERASYERPLHYEPAPPELQTSPRPVTPPSRLSQEHSSPNQSIQSPETKTIPFSRTLSISSTASTAFSAGAESSNSGSVYSDETHRTHKRRSSDKYDTNHSESTQSMRPSVFDTFSIASSSPTSHSHFRQGASSITSSEAPSPPSKDTPYQQYAPLHPDSGTMDDLMAAVGNAIDDIGLVKVADVPPPTVVQPSWDEKAESPTRQALDLHRRNESSSSFDQISIDRASVDGSSEHVFHVRDTSPQRDRHASLLTGGSEQGHRSSSSLSNVSKRFSAIRRTTSSLSLSKFPISLGQGYPRAPDTLSSAFPNIPAPRPERTRRLKRKVVGYPQAMSFQDVLRMKTALDRAAGYAEKINELAAEDCGLDAWISNVKAHQKGAKTRHTDYEIDTLSPLMSSTAPASFARPQAGLTRHMSRNSMSSEATFPIRPDAYAATNLRARPSDDSSSQVPPPALPYPSLASSMNRNQLSSGSGRSLASSTIGGKSGFFASIGRRASMKRERNQMLQAGYRPPARLPLGTPSPQPRPIQLEASPQLRGGPRPPPSRRSSVIVSSVITPGSPMTGPRSAPTQAPPNAQPLGGMPTSPGSRSSYITQPSLLGGARHPSPSRVSR